jgi:ribonuclease HI
MNEILIFTDGSSKGNPGPGGYGAIVVNHSHVTELGGTDPHTTNNRMELTGAIKALEFIKKESGSLSIKVFSDSQYVIKGMTEWLANWQKKNWRTANKKPVLNQELWIMLADLAQNLKIEWKYVAGHAGHDANERCDTIATSFADGNPVPLFSGDIKNYSIKISEKK